jgi:integrase
MLEGECATTSLFPTQLRRARRMSARVRSRPSHVIWLIFSSHRAWRRRMSPWNKGKLIGATPPLSPKQVWSIRIRLQLQKQTRDLALLNLGLDSKLRGCDLVRMRVDEVTAFSHIKDRASVLQRKTNRPVQFEMTEQTRNALQNWIHAAGIDSRGFLFPSRPRLAITSAPGSTQGWLLSGPQ